MEWWHGTLTGYTGKGCRCPLCKKARAKYQREHVKILLERPIPATVKHGTLNAYINYSCSCRDCKAANTEYYRKRRQSKKNGAE